jgi:hypothetical protein
MKRSVLFGVFLALVVVTVAFAQGKPNFAGTWTPPAPAAGAAPPAGGGGGGGRGGGPMTVTQTATVLTVERTMGENKIKTVYNLDGTESKNESPGRGGGAPTVSTSTVKWDGAKLLITTKSEGPSGPVERTQTWSLGADGNLTIEQPGQGGNVRTTVYTKGK